MPTVFVPLSNLELLKEIFMDSIGIALIAYVISLSLARIVASKHGYRVICAIYTRETSIFQCSQFIFQVDANQELIAQGLSNIFGSFFQSLPMAGSLSRLKNKSMKLTIES